MSINQKEAVTNAVLSLFPDYELGGEVNLASILTPETKKELRGILFAGFRADAIVMSAQAKAKYDSDDAGLTKYVSGLLDNWVRKNRAFNGGEQYVTKNPGSRAGSQDEQVKALRQLMKTTNDEGQIAQIQEALTARIAEIKPASVVTINVDALPESLRHLVK